MEKTSLSIFFAVGMLCVSLQLAAQSYNTALGLRLGSDWGITAQQRIADHTTIEGILQSSFARKEVVLSLLAEQHYKIISRRFNIYVGGGLHKGWLTDDKMEAKDPFGISLIGGLEFTMGRINLSYDFKPAINLIGGESWIYFHQGLSARYVIIKRESAVRNRLRDINWRFWE